MAEGNGDTAPFICGPLVYMYNIHGCIQFVINYFIKIKFIMVVVVITAQPVK